MNGALARVGAILMPAAVLAAPLVTGCYSSAQSARRSQTLASQSWGCLSDPVIECPNRPDGVCTGWDSRWKATCPDDDSVWVCRFANEGAHALDDRLDDDRVFCRRIDRR